MVQDFKQQKNEENYHTIRYI